MADEPLEDIFDTGIINLPPEDRAAVDSAFQLLCKQPPLPPVSDVIDRGRFAVLRGWYYGGTTLVWSPTRSKVGKVRMGTDPNHYGLDLFAPVGSDVISLTSGHAVGVVFKGFGLTVVVRFVVENVDYVVLYAHLKNVGEGIPIVEKSQLLSRQPLPPVYAGVTVLGESGCGGNASDNPDCGKPIQFGPFVSRSEHVHVELRRLNTWHGYPIANGTTLDPIEFFSMNVRYADVTEQVEYNRNGGFKVSPAPYSPLA